MSEYREILETTDDGLNPASIRPVSVPMSDEKAFARKVASYLIPAVVWATVIVGLYCQHHTQREPGELLMVMLVAMAGSVGLTHLVRLVTGR